MYFLAALIAFGKEGLELGLSHWSCNPVHKKKKCFFVMVVFHLNNNEVVFHLQKIEVVFQCQIKVVFDFQKN